MNLVLRGLKCLKENGIIYTIHNINGKISRKFWRKFILHNYYDDLRNRVNNYQSRYPLEPRKTAFRLLWWNFKQLFKKHVGDNDDRISASARKAITVQAGSVLPSEYHTPNDYHLTNDVLNIGFQIAGGIGDRLIAANYLLAFREKYGRDHVRIDILVNGRNSDNSIFREGYVVDHIYVKDPKKSTESYCGNYDLFIKLVRYPVVFQKHLSAIAKYEPDLIDYVYRCEAFRAHYLRFIDHAGITDGQSGHFSILNGKKRFQQADITGEFNLEETFRYELHINAPTEYLTSISLNNEMYITVHRGVDINYISTSIKLWPLGYYDVLLKLIKTCYPQIRIVQLGVSEERCPAMEYTDINLVGTTTMEEVKILLKNSLVHIDGEGGMVHLRHALNGGTSIVLFGPTSEEFYGYSENVNVRGNGCETWCEWCVEGWQEGCLRKIGGVPCMQSITPEMVFEKFEDLMAKRGIKHG